MLESQTPPMRDLPSGTVTFLFTDIEGSTRRWEADSRAMLAAVERHFALLDAAIRARNGVLFKTIGDAVQAAFPTALDGLLAAIDAQRAMLGEDWGAVDPLQVRIALHTGSATPRDGDYLAPSLNRLARLLSADAGGQILVSEATQTLLRDALPPRVQLRDLGEHRLRDLRSSEHVYQVVAEGLPDDFPPLKSLDRPLTNLPAQLTTFIGRSEELEEIAALLDDPAVRLLTLTGPGGTGKTRLALQAAADLLPAYADGVWFVALAPLTNGTLVPAAIAEALGVRETSGESIEEALRTCLQGKRMLLVLDNFEHVVGMAPLVSTVLANAPFLQILTTSRAPLRVAGERELPISPLGLPEEGKTGLPEARDSEAVRLFVDRVRGVRPDFVLNERNAATVAAICRRLDGLPLAIELAAARIRLFPVEAILARLDSRLALLTGGDRDRPERQQTLRGAIAWSHDLLSPDKQAFFRRLAIFVGGWTFDASEAVASVPPPLDCFDSLAVLAENSLIQQRDAEEMPEPRFSMLETIREYAREQLVASDEYERVAEAHAAFYLQLAVAAEPHLTGPEALIWLRRLDRDRENLRTALEWLRERGDSARAVQLAAALWRFWWLRGEISQGRQQVEATLAMSDLPTTDPNLAAALDGAGVLAETQSDYDRAEELHRQALALSRNSGNREGSARSLGNLGVIAADRGSLDEAASLLTESLAEGRQTGQKALIATALNDLGGVAYSRGELGEAEALFAESLALRRRHGSASEIARTLNNMGFIALNGGDFPRARAMFEESLALYRQSGDKWGAGGPLYGLAMAYQLDGELASSTPLLEESLALFEETGDAHNAAIAQLNLAETALSQGELDRAGGYFQEALERFHTIDDRARIADTLTGIGRLLARRGHQASATRLLSAASALAGADRPPDEETIPGAAELNLAREALGAEAFAAAWRDGQGLGLEEAVAEAERVRPAGNTLAGGIA